MYKVSVELVNYRESKIYTRADKMFPAIVTNRIRFRPYLSDRDPILGDTKNCKVLKDV